MNTLDFYFVNSVNRHFNHDSFSGGAAGKGFNTFGAAYPDIEGYTITLPQSAVITSSIGENQAECVAGMANALFLEAGSNDKNYTAMSFEACNYKDYNEFSGITKKPCIKRVDVVAENKKHGTDYEIATGALLQNSNAEPYTAIADNLDMEDTFGEFAVNFDKNDSTTFYFIMPQKNTGCNLKYARAGLNGF